MAGAREGGLAEAFGPGVLHATGTEGWGSGQCLSPVRKTSPWRDTHSPGVRQERGAAAQGAWWWWWWGRRRHLWPVLWDLKTVAPLWYLG